MVVSPSYKYLLACSYHNVYNMLVLLLGSLYFGKLSNRGMEKQIETAIGLKAQEG